MQAAVQLAEAPPHCHHGTAEQLRQGLSTRDQAQSDRVAHVAAEERVVGDFKLAAALLASIAAVHSAGLACMSANTDAHAHF